MAWLDTLFLSSDVKSHCPQVNLTWWKVLQSSWVDSSQIQLTYRVTKVLGDTYYVDIKMRVACCIKSLHLSGPLAQISSSSQQNLCPRVFCHPIHMIRVYFYVALTELIGSLKLGNVWIQLIHRLTRTKNQLYKNPNIAKLETSYQLCSLTTTYYRT